MDSASHSQDPVIKTVIQDRGHDLTHPDPAAPHGHDQATEVRHAWDHFFADCRFFACFFAIIVLTVATWSINLGPEGNKIFVFTTAALRSGLIAYYMLTLFKSFSLVKNTFAFSALFLAGMIFLSWWDSELRGIGDPIKDRKNIPGHTTEHVP